jgi:tetratricopeptide (TPR) repeat protein
VQQWLAFDASLRMHQEEEAASAGPAIPASDIRTIPSCSLCKRYKSYNGQYGANRAAGMPVQDWEREYMCEACTREFAGLADQLKNEVDSPTLPAEALGLLCTIMLKLAEEGLDDPLAIATAKTYLGMMQQDEGAITLLEDARSFLSRHSAEGIVEDTFHSQMEIMYQHNMFVLGQRYMITGALAKAMPLLKEGLAFDEAAGDRLNIAKSKASLGELLAMLGYLDKAEPLLLASLDARHELGTNPLPALFPLVQLYMKKQDREGLATHVPELKRLLAGAVDADPEFRGFLAAIDHMLAS